MHTDLLCTPGRAAAKMSVWETQAGGMWCCRTFSVGGGQWFLSNVCKLLY